MLSHHLTPRVTAAGPRVRGPGDLGRGEPGHRAAAALLHPAAVRVLAGLQARHQVTPIKYSQDTWLIINVVSRPDLNVTQWHHVSFRAARELWVPEIR